MNTSSFSLNGRVLGPGKPPYLVAEMSANHGGDFDRAVNVLRAAKDAGADAVKLQTYTADTLTIAADNEYFRIKGTLWDGRTLHDLYQEAAMPWEWTPRLMEAGVDLGLPVFSTPFDATAVNFLESLDVPVHKVASFELVDIPLLRKVGGTGKPVIASTGMASLAEIDEAVRTLRDAGCTELVLLKCVSAYPAPADEMRLSAIPLLSRAFGCPAGLSDHTLGITVPVAATVLGACCIEKHFTLSRALPGPDSAFSLEPQEFKAMATATREAFTALGEPDFSPTPKEESSRIFRRSLFVVEDVRAGEAFTTKNVRSIRPGNGLHTRFQDVILGRRASRDIPRGTPLSWDLVGN
jgi:N-acetylneuraminate synthase